MKTGRRKFLKRAFLATVGLGLAGAGYSFLIEPSWILVTRRRIRIPGLAAQLDGKTVAHLSDLHLGLASPGYVERCVERTNALAPDLVALTGDYVGRRRQAESREAARILSRLRAPLGSSRPPGTTTSASTGREPGATGPPSWASSRRRGSG